MENASKALIIAGAILLSILIIGLGMFIYQQAADAMGGANLDSEQANAYNSKFLTYADTQKGTAVRALLDVVRNHNNINVDDPSEQVGFIFNSDNSADHGSGSPNTDEGLDDPVDSAALTTIKSSIRAGRTYTVTFVYAKSGKIKCVVVNDKVDNP